jgi:GNAT superfamily N-acetyltransferase
MTIYHRFLAALTELTPTMARYLSSVDHRNRVALIAETETEPIGVARYELTNDPDAVELGLLVVDAWQNRGLGRILLREIFRAAEENGIRRLCAYVLGENTRMLRLLASESQIQDSTVEAGIIALSFTARPGGQLVRNPGLKKLPGW